MEQQQLYAEAGCKPRTGGKDYLMRAGAVFFAAVLIFIALFTSVGFLIKLGAVAGVAAIVYLFPNLIFEYEYIFCDGQLDFDKIMNGAKRKTMLQVDFEQVECIAPEKSHSAQGYHDAKIMDFSSGDMNHKRYVVLCKVKEQRTKIYFEPSERMLTAMQAKAPKKVQV